MLKELKEQTKWLKFLALDKIRKVIEESVKTKEQKAIYSLSDVVNSTNNIASLLAKNGIKIILYPYAQARKNLC